MFREKLIAIRRCLIQPRADLRQLLLQQANVVLTLFQKIGSARRE